MEDVTLEIIRGVEGLCIAINGRRVAGPKPWGGGRAIAKLGSTKQRITESLKLA